MKQYKVIPFTAEITANDTTQKVADQLQDLINKVVTQGWEFRDVQSIQTKVAPMGCFGANKKDETTAFVQLVVFSKEE